MANSLLPATDFANAVEFKNAILCTPHRIRLFLFVLLRAPSWTILCCFGGIVGEAQLDQSERRLRAATMPARTQLLLDQALAGNDPARGMLLQSYSGYLNLLARVQIGRKLQGKADALDLVQDTFLEAHRQFTNFRGRTEPELTAWLRKIMAGQLALLIRQYLGTKARDVRLEKELGQSLDQSSSGMDMNLAGSFSTPSQKASRREQSVLLAEALDQLPASYREVIVLRHLEGLNVAAIAARMNRSEDSVQKLWVRGLAALRVAMEKTS